ncbi:MAG: hypothetical protein HYX63_11970 [Gammaproteobacteria bacterium]|nr:hypothetical protein [Gammaproteobacteria bacterium]
MSESSWGLRLALLLIGVAIVAGVYFVGIVRRRRDQIRTYPRRGKRWRNPVRDREPEFEADESAYSDPVDDEIIAVRVRTVEQIPELPRVTKEVRARAQPTPEPSPPAPESESHATPRKGRVRRTLAQLSFGFGADGHDQTVDESGRSAGDADEPAVLVLHFRPPQATEFTGSQIVRQVNAVGMRHGDPGVFHHYGAGDLSTEKPLFSLANMFEPGTFDLQRIESFTTAGLVMFLRLPAALDGAVAFELFLNTGQRLAEGLQASLFADQNTVLDSANIDRMRRVAARFAAPHA